MGHVYFIKSPDSNLVKIGKTGGEVRKRKREIQNMCPVTLYTLGIVRADNYSKIERELHELFAPIRQHGEWFEFDGRRLGTLKKCFKKIGTFDYEGFKSFWQKELDGRNKAWLSSEWHLI